jgi:hypothetical protein
MMERGMLARVLGRVNSLANCLLPWFGFPLWHIFLLLPAGPSRGGRSQHNFRPRAR